MLVRAQSGSQIGPVADHGRVTAPLLRPSRVTRWANRLGVRGRDLKLALAGLVVGIPVAVTVALIASTPTMPGGTEVPFSYPTGAPTVAVTVPAAETSEPAAAEPARTRLAPVPSITFVTLVPDPATATTAATTAPVSTTGATPTTIAETSDPPTTITQEPPTSADTPPTSADSTSTLVRATVG